MVEWSWAFRTVIVLILLSQGSALAGRGPSFPPKPRPTSTPTASPVATSTPTPIPSSKPNATISPTPLPDEKCDDPAFSPSYQVEMGCCDTEAKREKRPYCLSVTPAPTPSGPVGDEGGYSDPFGATDESGGIASNVIGRLGDIYQRLTHPFSGLGGRWSDVRIIRLGPGELGPGGAGGGIVIAF